MGRAERSPRLGGVDRGEGTAIAVGRAVEAVAGGARRIPDDRLALADAPMTGVDVPTFVQPTLATMSPSVRLRSFIERLDAGLTCYNWSGATPR